MVRSPVDYNQRYNESADDSDPDLLRDDPNANDFTSILTPRHPPPPPSTFLPLVNYSPTTSTDQSPEGRARKASQADLRITAQGLADSLQPPEQMARKKLSTITEVSDEVTPSGASKF